MKLLKFIIWLQRHKVRPIPRVYLFLVVLLGFLIGFFFIKPLITNANILQTDERELYSESIKFDSSGNLLITTRDQIASTNTRYKTIGWTISSEDGKYSVKIPQMKNGESQIDPNDTDYIYNYFICDSSEIYEAVEKTSKQWLQSLYLKGGTIKLDAIMTIVENGIALGSMDFDGNFYGEVYDTYEEISNSRPWYDKEGLNTHFNKSLNFVPDPDEIIDTPEEDKDSEVIKIEYGYEYLKDQAKCKLYSQEYDVKKGIPSTELIIGEGEFQKYYYDLKLRKVWGTVNVPVEVTVSGEETYTFTVYISRPYEYYRAIKLKYGELDRCTIKSESVKGNKMEIAGGSGSFSYSIGSHAGDYLRIDSANITVNSDMNMDEIMALAEKCASNKVSVRNDKLIVDGEILMNDIWHLNKASSYKTKKGPRLVNLSKSGEVACCTNGKKSVTATVEYTGTKRKLLNLHDIDPVIVHTPVVCNITLSDDISHNQQVNPTSEASFIIGRNASVDISFSGKHRDIKGYGTRDYSKYIKKVEVCFSFDVTVNGSRVKANEWIEIKNNTLNFQIPLGTREGDYEIKSRVRAINAQSTVWYEILANQNLENHGAKNSKKATIMGRLYDLQVEKIIDYPRWNLKNTVYPCGLLDIDGRYSSEKSELGLSPVISDGSDKYASGVIAPGLGYTINYSIKTLGDMRGDSDYVAIEPKCYYLTRNGTTRREVKLYDSRTMKEITPKAIILDKDSRKLLKNGSVQKWCGSFHISPDVVAVDSAIDLKTYINKKGGRISANDKVFLKKGYLCVNFKITSIKDGALHLSYVNSKNSSKGYCNENRLQGFKYERIDKDGNKFSFEDGDFIIYDMKKGLRQDYGTEGTH